MNLAFRPSKNTSFGFSPSKVLLPTASTVSTCSSQALCEISTLVLHQIKGYMRSIWSVLRARLERRTNGYSEFPQLGEETWGHTQCAQYPAPPSPVTNGINYLPTGLSMNSLATSYPNICRVLNFVLESNFSTHCQVPRSRKELLPSVLQLHFQETGLFEKGKNLHQSWWLRLCVLLRLLDHLLVV